jgi:hypothetical protein
MKELDTEEYKEELATELADLKEKQKTFPTEYKERRINELTLRLERM